MPSNVIASRVTNFEKLTTDQLVYYFQGLSSTVMNSIQPWTVEDSKDILQQVLRDLLWETAQLDILF